MPPTRFRSYSHSFWPLANWRILQSSKQCWSPVFVWLVWDGHRYRGSGLTAHGQESTGERKQLFQQEYPHCCYSVFLGLIVAIQSLSCIQLFATPWTAACQASLSITNFQSLFKPMSTGNTNKWWVEKLCLLQSTSSLSSVLTRQPSPLACSAQLLVVTP